MYSLLEVHILRHIGFILLCLVPLGSSMHGDRGGANSTDLPNDDKKAQHSFLMPDRLSRHQKFVLADLQLGDDGNTSHVTDDPNDVIIPIPDWPAALKEWGVCWQVHMYGSATLFLLLTLVSLVIFFRFQARVRRFQIVLNILVLLATSGLLRGIFMLVDPYGYRDTMAGLMVGVMTQAVYPLLCACYGLTQVLLIRVTNVDVGPSKLRSLSALLGCTLAYLFLVVVVETIVFYERHLKLLLLLDSGCFIAWALYLGITFICSGFRLTQYTSETKKARKELNAFSNQRRSASNNTALSAISGTSGDTRGVSTIKADMTSFAASSSDATSKELGSHNSALDGDTTPDPNCYSSLAHQGNHTRTSGGLRMSRPKIKISNRNHMTITIVTDDDDQSTSSTDVEKSVAMELTQTRALRKVYKHRHKKQGASSKIRVSLEAPGIKGLDETDVDEQCGSDTKEDDNDDDLNGADSKYFQLPTDDTGASGVNTKGRMRKKWRGAKHSPAMTKETSELPLLESCHIAPKRHYRREESALIYPLTADENNCRYFEVPDTRSDTSVQWNHKKVHSPSNSVQATTTTRDMDACDGDKEIDTGTRTGDAQLLNTGRELNLPSGVPTRGKASNELSVPSALENGYLSDNENIPSGTRSSKLGNRQYGRTGSHVIRRLQDTDSSDQSDISSCADSDGENSATSEFRCDRFQCTLPASVGLFRIRQSKMVHRAVYLTYFVTFLFMFACLMQLYTVFGVYGVLGTIQRPDPWPWLVFHSIYRLLECSIGFTVATIAFIALNHRHQRAKRRLQQQQQQHQQQQQQQQQYHHPLVHLDDQASTVSMTRDCVV